MKALYFQKSIKAFSNKNNIIFIMLLLLGLIDFIPKLVWASAADNLRIRLNEISSFYSTFTQEITDGSGKVIQKGRGDLWVRRPSFFNMHMIQPDENILVSDGRVLLFYNPFVEQATVTWLKDAVHDTPFIMIIRNQISDWKRYTIKQLSNTFELIPKTSDGKLKKFDIDISKDGIIRQFSVTQQDGQHSYYQFTSYKKEKTIDMSRFSFTLPNNVTIDDQRSENE